MLPPPPSPPPGDAELVSKTLAVYIRIDTHIRTYVFAHAQMRMLRACVASASRIHAYANMRTHV